MILLCVENADKREDIKMSESTLHWIVRVLLVVVGVSGLMLLKRF